MSSDTRRANAGEVLQSLNEELKGTPLGVVKTGAPAPAARQQVTVEKITVSKTYNLGNYQSARLEAECSVPETDVQDRATLSDYYAQALQALDEAFRRNFQNKQQ